MEAIRGRRRPRSSSRPNRSTLSAATAQQQKEILREHFQQEGWEVPRLLELMESAPDFYFDSVSQVKMDRWSAGRSVLLGDAAYCASPLSGMGTGMAVVGAYVLAGELAEAEWRLPCGLREI